MATFPGETIIDRVRVLLEDGGGSVRTIAASTYRGNLHLGLDEGTQSLRSLGKPSAEAHFSSGPTPNPASPFSNSTTAILDFEIEVTVVRAATAEHKLDDDVRDALKGALATDADVVRQALTWPGNMNVGGILSSTLFFESVDAPELELERDTGALGRVRIRFRGTALVTQAIS